MSHDSKAGNEKFRKMKRQKKKKKKKTQAIFILFARQTLQLKKF